MSATAEEAEPIIPSWGILSRNVPASERMLSPTAEAGAWADLPNLARLVVNGDPSQEHIFEPWGGYPASGANPVDHWPSKYQRLVQIDGPLSPH